MTVLRTLLGSLCGVSLFFAPPLLAKDLVFQELWGYWQAGEQKALSPDLPLTDVAVFAASINSRGQLVDVPAPPDRSKTSARRHLVLAELGNFALTHFVLDPAYPLRNALVAALVTAALPYDGVQIDFEAVAGVDRENYLAFLQKLKRTLGPKMLSVAVPARWKAVDDAQSYSSIARVVDRVIIMAYDEHWSTSAPGPIASVEWGSKVAEYALRIIGGEKVVMGLPFYGRVWSSTSPSGGYRYSGVERLQTENALEPVRDSGGVPWFEFSRTLTFTGWYEDVVSLEVKTTLYQGMGVRNLAFWRLGQEDPRVWPMLLTKLPRPFVHSPPDPETYRARSQ